MNTALVRIRKGLNLRLAGAPALEVADAPSGPTVAIHPLEFPGFRPRLLVQEGATVARGTPLVENKANPAFKLCSPAGGTVKSVVLGERRALEKIVIAVAPREDTQPIAGLTPGHPPATREALINILLTSGYLGLIRQRPFGGIAKPDAKPKSIFVNGMATGPFQTDLHAAVRGEEAAFQAGLDALTRLTDGPVFLCLDAAAPQPSAAVTGAKNVQIRYFQGPHPAGNTSVHIHHLDAISPGDTVWTMAGTDVILLGRLLLDGVLPTHRVIALGGPAVKPEARRHYRVRIGAELAPLLAGQLADGELRVLAGDVLSGSKLDPAGHLPAGARSLTVLREGRERMFLGWMAPGFARFSFSRLFPAGWGLARRAYDLDTNINGGHRAMVATGLYDRFLPMKIRADYLIRAVLAKDTEEAVQLGLLEVLPEDFALCAYACPSKTDLVGIFRQGLADVEAEGL